MWVKRFAQEHNTMSLARAQTRAARSGDVSTLTMRHHSSIEDQTLGKLTSCDDDFTCVV